MTSSLFVSDGNPFNIKNNTIHMYSPYQINIM